MVTPRAELSARLSSLGLSQYEKTLVENGFDTWQSVLAIEESDLETLQFKLGHRRRLQRELHRTRKGLHQVANSPEAQSESGSRRKRRYKRHPKPDQNAPQRPRTGYVLFSDQLRTSPEVSAMPFVEISKHVGKLWQELGPEGRREWESKAGVALAAYQNEMTEYKRTKEFEEYSHYLENFHRQQRDKEVAESSKVDAASTDTDPNPPAASDVFGSSWSKASSLFGDSVDFTSTLNWAWPGILNEPLSIDQILRGMANLAEDEPRHIEVFNERHLPPQASTSQAVVSFCSGTGALLSLYPKDDVRACLDHVWNNDGSGEDRYALMDVLAMAALGSYYDNDKASKEMRESFFYSCIQCLLGLRGANTLRCMRLLLCLSTYYVLESPKIARLICGVAFQVGRSSLICGDEGEPSHPEGITYWRNIFRTVALMECWFAFQLGYQSPIQDSDIAFACVWTFEAPDSIEGIVQDQYSKLWALAAEIWRKHPSSSPINEDTVRIYAEKLDSWHGALPPVVQLSTLSSPQNSALSPLQRRSVLLTHLFYLSTVTALHGKIVVGITDAEEERNWNVDMSKEEISKYHGYCIIAAQQAARIASLLESSGTTRSQWAAVYPVFSVCSLLLFSAAQRLLQPSSSRLEEDLKGVRSCIGLLKQCIDADCVMKYLDVVQTLHETLVNIKSETLPDLGYQALGGGSPSKMGKQSTSKTSPHPLLESVITEARMLLHDPFRMAREGERKQSLIDGAVGGIVDGV